MSKHATRTHLEPGAPRSPLPWRRPASTRVRLLGWYLAVTVLGLALGIFAQRSLLLAQLDDEVDAQLLQEVEELRRLVDGRDPETGEPFGDDIRAIFDTFLRRNLPVENEALFTLVDGRPHASTVAPLQLLDDADLVAAWASLDTPAQDDMETEAGRVRYLAAPVSFDGRVMGTFVAAYFLEDSLADISNVIRTGALLFLGVVVVSAIAFWFAIGSILRPIAQLTAAARSVSESNWADRIAVQGDNEVAFLARTFNDMLDRLEAAFEAQRRLVDDAGHELRTPITIIRGHLELASDDAAEWDETMRLVRDELGRMGRIVEDLLLLARTEQRDFLDLQPVDLDEFTHDLAAKAAALGDQAWTMERSAIAVVLADPQRLTQAVMNLCRNAVEHTPEGTPVSLGSEMVGEHHYAIWVQDQGPGIASVDQQRIFDRFARGTDGRRTGEGAGLGLAIVQAIVRAHGGRVRLDSTPGKGSRFTLILPASPPAQEPASVRRSEVGQRGLDRGQA